MKKKVIRLNESDIENLVKKIIKEEQLDEIGGYDSPELGVTHSKNNGTSYEQYLNDVWIEVDEIENLIYGGNGLGYEEGDDGEGMLEGDIEGSIGHLIALQGEIEFKSSLSPQQKQYLVDIIEKTVRKAERFIGY